MQQEAVKKIPEVTEVKAVSTPVSRQKHFLFQGILITTIGGFIILMLLVRALPVLVFDLPITRFIQQFNPVWFDLLMKAMTMMGNTIPGTVIVVLILMVLILYKKRLEALMVLFSSAGVLVLTSILKTFVGRPRPDPSLILQIGHFAKSDSFPSGHVLTSMGLYGFLLFLTSTKFKKGGLKTFLITLFLAILILMGLSRIYLGAHWFSDVLGSYLIGTVWLYFMVWLYKRLAKPRI